VAVAGVSVAQARVLRFTVPVPPEETNPNRHVDRWTKADAAREQRGWWQMAALEVRQRSTLAGAWQGVFGKARLSAVVTWCTGRRRIDDDNLISSLKSGRDGLRDAGIVRDDSLRWLTWGQITQQRCPRGCRCGGRVEVTVEETV